MYQCASILYHLTTARRLRSGDTQRSGECKGEQSPFRVSPRRHMHDDISVFDVWHISTVDMYFDISARILAYQWTFGISARDLTYQPGFWHINRAPFRHVAYHFAKQWEAVRFDFVKHTGVLGRYKDADSKTHQDLFFLFKTLSHQRSLTRPHTRPGPPAGGQGGPCAVLSCG